MEKNYDNRHGGPWDRGSSDSYYRRDFNPHYYVGGTYDSKRVENLNEYELEAYRAGYQQNTEEGNFKEY